MEFKDRESIDKFLDIAVLSKSGARLLSKPQAVDIAIKERGPESLTVECKGEHGEEALRNWPARGILAFTSFNMQFETSFQLLERIEHSQARISLPDVLLYSDRRSCPRILFDSREHKIFKLWCERNKLRFNAMLYDLCMDGMAFFVLDQNVALKNGDLIYLDDILLGQ